jgi:putative membrane protein
VHVLKKSGGEISRAATPVARRALALCAAACALAQTAFAHEGKPHTWHDLARAWAFEPVVVLSLALSGLLYVVGVRKLWRGSAAGRGVRKWEAWCYAGGWLALFVALVSPLHPWGRVLFSAHMTQHEVLMLIAAPLVVLGRPVVAFLWALPLEWARAVGNWAKSEWWQKFWRALTNPLVAWVVHAVALWAWHVPALFQATLRSEWVHTAQHLSFLVSALLFWWALVHGRQGWMGYGAATLYVFTTSIHGGLTASWGLTPLEDQQLGGLIMWMPAGLVYIAAGLALFAGWVRESDATLERRARRAARADAS